jgi:Na+/melibiose symporter-like transporter
VRFAILVNAVLALATEIALLVAAVGIGLLTPAPLPLRVVLAVLLPVAVIVVWGTLLAPRAVRRVGPRARLLTEAALFALAAVGLALVGAAIPAVALTVVAGARLILGAAVGRV